MILRLDLLHWECFQARQFHFLNRLCERVRVHVYCVCCCCLLLSPLAAAAVLPPAHLVSMHVDAFDNRGFLWTP